jgi:TPR repeat protein
LAYNLDNAVGGPKNLAEANRWYRKAAEAGSPLSMFNLGVQYRDGDGLEKNHREAYNWFSKAAANGNTAALYSLAQANFMGWGVAKNSSKAAGFMLRALKAGYQFAIKQMTTNANAWDVTFRRELQRQMKQEGVYAGVIDGQFGPATKRAIEALAKR